MQNDRVTYYHNLESYKHVISIMCGKCHHVSNYFIGMELTKEERDKELVEIACTHKYCTECGKRLEHTVHDVAKEVLKT